jgi:curved DNA-binding protein
MPQQVASQQLDVEITLDEAFQGTSRQLSRPDGSSLTAKIPKGVKTGSKIKLRGAVNGQDVYLVVTVLPHGRYERDGDDLSRATTVTPSVSNEKPSKRVPGVS